MQEISQLRFGSVIATEDTILEIMAMARQVLADNRQIEGSDNFIRPLRRKLEEGGYMFSPHCNLGGHRRGQKRIVDIVIATSPPIAIEIKAERDFNRQNVIRGQIHSYAICPWIAGVLLLNFQPIEGRVQGWWVAQGGNAFLLNLKEPNYEEVLKSGGEVTEQ